MQVDVTQERLLEMNLQPGETIFVAARHARVFAPEYDI